MQCAYNGKVTVHASGAIQISGETDTGRTISIYLTTANVAFLAQIFAFAAAHGLGATSLGHAAWHITEETAGWREPGAPCSSCDCPSADTSGGQFRGETR